jgi:hypothetical protein
MLGTLLAGGAGPALAQPVLAAAPAAGTETPYRQTFEADARARLRVWSDEITAFDNKVDATGTATDSAAGQDLDTAWAETKAEEQKLEVAAADKWEDARITYDHAAQHFQATLDRARDAL